ncbi:MAG: hypothetical protein ACRD25_00285 [Terracidiphilus sp.]
MPIPNSIHYSAVIPGVVGLMLLWPFGDTAKKISMTPAKEVPAAHGTVAVKTGRNGNIEVAITTKALAQASALTPPAETYVVWFQPPDQSPKNMGALRVDNNLNGKLETVAPYRHFKVFITAEKQRNVASPHGTKVLTAEVAG